jgi:hypothetical protein
VAGSDVTTPASVAAAASTSTATAGRPDTGIHDPSSCCRSSAGLGASRTGWQTIVAGEAGSTSRDGAGLMVIPDSIGGGMDG